MNVYRAKYNESYLYVNSRKFGFLGIYRKEGASGLFFLDEDDNPKPLREGTILRNGLGNTLPYRKWEWTTA